MNFERHKSKIIEYPPEKLRDFHKYCYEWIDNLNFTLGPEECLDDARSYISIVKEILQDEGWDGDGRIELMWIPSFMLESGDPKGVTI